MFTTVIIIATLFVLGNGQTSSSEEITCDCVFPKYCTDFKESTANITLRNYIDEEDTGSCESKLKICCDVKNILQPQPGDSSEDQPVQENCGGRNEQGIMFNLVHQNLESQFGEFPWMIEISNKQETNDMFSKPVYRYFAGGSLIHPSVVLTAAHKVYDKDVSSLRIRAGEWDQKSKHEPLPHQDRKVVRMVIHDQLNRANGVNSLALLFLDEPFKIQDHINTICLPPPNTSFENERCFVTGWGADARSNDRQKVNILKKIDVPVVPHEECQRMLRKTEFGQRFRLNPNLLCAGGEEGKDSCDGDGGSPLVCPIPNTVQSFYLAGFVVGGTAGCGVIDQPALYSKISNYIGWINSHIGGL